MLDKILICVTEDWFALSHFKPLIRALTTVAREVVVATRDSGRMGELAALGCRPQPFDYHRASTNPLREAESTRRLAALFRRERPDAVHLIALKPITLGAMAAAIAPVPAVGVHLTGLGLLATAATAKARTVRRIALGLTGTLIRRPSTQLFVENPDDVEALKAVRADPGDRVTILGGAGVDPDHFRPEPWPANDPPVAAYVGRMIRSKGLDTLVAAAERIAATGPPLAIDLYGRIDDDNPEAFSGADIAGWQQRGLVRWHGHVDDVREVWRRADIFVMCPRGGEGLPRSLLEAAACGRPAVVTDVPGCRHFVRDGIEGCVVPPGDPEAMAAALSGLADDPARRIAMGAKARERLLSGYTERHVMDAVVAGYRALAARSRR